MWTGIALGGFRFSGLLILQFFDRDSEHITTTAHTSPCIVPVKRIGIES